MLAISGGISGPQGRKSRRAGVAGTREFRCGDTRKEVSPWEPMGALRENGDVEKKEA